MMSRFISLSHYPMIFKWFYLLIWKLERQRSTIHGFPSQNVHQSQDWSRSKNQKLKIQPKFLLWVAGPKHSSYHPLPRRAWITRNLRKEAEPGLNTGPTHDPTAPVSNLTTSLNASPCGFFFLSCVQVPPKHLSLAHPSGAWNSMYVWAKFRNCAISKANVAPAWW